MRTFFIFVSSTVSIDKDDDDWLVDGQEVAIVTKSSFNMMYWNKCCAVVVALERNK